MAAAGGFAFCVPVLPGDSLGRKLGMPDVGDTTRMRLGRTVGQICSICVIAERAAAPESGSSRTCCLFAACRAAFLFAFAEFVQQVADLSDLAGRAAHQQAASCDVGIDARRFRIGLIALAAEEFVDREYGDLRIDVRQRDHVDLLGFLLHLVDRGFDRRLLRRRGERERPGRRLCRR